ncbi:hypothetical protein TNIN_180651 [Trichonephila inaurata madagascariensis]|uniref:Uncharacterized protein n=1 Tax=Trichonephila inaurata madagascariensis TaxID=2747483 RepID=A0A8X6WQ77_9ARAC|nr:hypothetical protein TNIN_180651 [Trichonephila inaurata madagascariensis]
MIGNIILCALLIEIVCFAGAEPFANETANDTEALDMRIVSDRVSSFMSRLYERSDRYELISHMLRAVAEHFFVLVYYGTP